MFAFIIILRILFAVCMVFVIGYIFGGFSKRPVLAGFSKAAAILAIVLFIGTNLMLNRFWFNRDHMGGWRCNEKEWRDHRFDGQRQQPPAAVPPASPQPSAP